MIASRRFLLPIAILNLSAGFASAQPYLISTYAGGLPGATAATATAYSVGGLNAVATDHFGNTYISSNLNCVFRMDPNGLLSLVAGTCKSGFSGDGASAVNAQLNNPQGIALDAVGNLYISDSGNQRVRRVTPAGIISTIAGTGTPDYSGDKGQATAAQLNTPQGIVVDPAGNIYIADQYNQRIRKIAPGGVITTVAGNGASGSTGDGGLATSATLTFPISLTIDSSGNLYVGDESYQVRKISVGGVITHFAGNGVKGYAGDSGPASGAEIGNPQGLTVDAAGNVFIADLSNSRVRKIDTGGIISTYAGGGSAGLGDNGPATASQLVSPSGVAVDYSENVYIADQSYRLRRVNAGGTITTAAGTGAPPFSGDGGQASLAQFASNWGIVRDGSGNIYVADWKNNRVRKITPAGAISTYAGTGSGVDSGDGAQAVNAGVTPHVLAIDSNGNLFLADNGLVRKVAPGGVISTVAGTGQAGFSGDNGPATSATMSSYLPGLAIDSNFNLYISDYSNNRIRKVTQAGTITTVAGTGVNGSGGDGGPATSAQLNAPTGLAVDTSGNLYICDYGNNRIRKVATNGNISTIATTQGGPFGILVDGSGNVYVATDQNTILEVSPQGVVSTVAGTGVAGYSGDGGPATAAQLSFPVGLVQDPSGNIYVSDIGNDAVRILQPVGTEPLLSVSSTHASNFIVGQANAAYTITLSNAAQAAATSGTVTVSENLPPGLTPVSIAGSGWTCGSNSCTTTGSQGGGTSYPAITVLANVTSAAAPQVTNLVTVSGGGSPGAAGADSTFVGAPAAVLQLAVTHVGNFSRSQTGATYTVFVGNQANAVATSGTVSAADAVPTGLTLVSMAGNAWTCSANTCSRSDALGGGAIYDPLTVTVNVASSAPAQVTNQVTASGGGSTSVTVGDLTNIGSVTCDVNGDGLTNVSDVQLEINEALGIVPASNDLNGDGLVNVADVQIVINAALGLGCAAH